MGAEQTRVNRLTLSDSVSARLYFAFNAEGLLTQRVNLGSQLLVHCRQCLLLNLELRLLDDTIVLIDQQV